MRQFNVFKGTKGWISMWERVLRFRYMITETAKRRTQILAFWEKHGLPAASEAFNVSRPTIFRWQKALRASGGKLEALNKQSTAPKRRRKRQVPDHVADFIIRERAYDPRLGKNKLAVLLKADGLASLSASTVGRMLGDLKSQGRLPDYTRYSYFARSGTLREHQGKRRNKHRRPQGYRVLEVDTVIRFLDGVKRYVLTAVDTETRIAFAAAYTNHGSASAADFLKKLQVVLPDCPEAIQTDNGSEFAAHFALAVSELGLTHFHTYPRSPKENSQIERFNRTLDEAFLKQRRGLLRDDVPELNRELMDWLVWYNTRRPHWSLGLVSPLRYICNQLSVSESQMCWTNTRA